MRRTALLTLAALLLAGSTPASAGPGHFWRSLLLPGWGQHAAGRGDAARRFLLTEAVLWAGYVGLQEVTDVRRQTVRTWATTHAGADTRGKPGEYFDDLGFYASHHQHNLYARVEDGPDVELYADTPEFAWAWDEEASRERYRELRNAASAMERNALYVTGLVLVNHLVSAVHAARIDRPVDLHEDLDSATSWHVAPVAASDGLVLGWSRRF
jgi:hypothetical protein